MSMEIHGYKAFNKGLTNRYGKEFEVGETYEISGPLKFGNNGNGFHFCERLEDTLRYFPAMEEEIEIACVTALGNIEEYEDNYYGYYDMYCTDIIRIDRVLEREEIINMFLDKNNFRVMRFIKGFKLTPNELDLYKLTYESNSSVMDAIAYYQEGDKEVYKRKAKLRRLRKTN